MAKVGCLESATELHAVAGREGVVIERLCVQGRFIIPGIRVAICSKLFPEAQPQ